MPPCLHGQQAFAAASAEFLRADHQMVRCQCQDRLGAQASRIGRRRGHCRARIAARRLDQDIDLHADLLGLLLGHETIGVVGGDHRPAEQATVGDPLQRLLEGRLLAQQRHELLGHALARQRPQALAGTADQDNGRNLRHSRSFRRKGASLWGGRGRVLGRDIAEGKGRANGRPAAASTRQSRLAEGPAAPGIIAVRLRRRFHSRSDGGALPVRRRRPARGYSRQWRRSRWRRAPEGWWARW